MTKRWLGRWLSPFSSSTWACNHNTPYAPSHPANLLQKQQQEKQLPGNLSFLWSRRDLAIRQDGRVGQNLQDLSFSSTTRPSCTLPTRLHNTVDHPTPGSQKRKRLLHQLPQHQCGQGQFQVQLVSPGAEPNFIPTLMYLQSAESQKPLMTRLAHRSMEGIPWGWGCRGPSVPGYLPPAAFSVRARTQHAQPSYPHAVALEDIVSVERWGMQRVNGRWILHRAGERRGAGTQTLRDLFRRSKEAQGTGQGKGMDNQLLQTGAQRSDTGAPWGTQICSPWVAKEHGVAFPWPCGTHMVEHHGFSFV